MELRVAGTGYVQNDFDDVESHDFGIDSEDEDVVVSILRDKIYSNPIQVLCQEYICNGRDSNISAGNPYHWLEIFVPNHAVPEFRVRDRGTGLSKEEIRKVYIKLGKSTKRTSDKFIGAYGLGSKSGFAYTDSFFITSWYNGTKIEAIALIAENQKGSIKFLSETPTDEPNGVEITVNLKDEKDIRPFVKAIFRTTAFWEEKPVYLNILEHETKKFIPEVKFRNEDILITKSTDLVNDNKMILCDGVPYPTIHSVDFGGRLGAAYGYNYFFITTNKEVKPAASRENITQGENLERFIQSIPNKIDKIADSHLERIRKCESLADLGNAYGDIPFSVNFKDYSLECLPSDVLFKGSSEIYFPDKYRVYYSHKGSTKWTHHLADDYYDHSGKILYFVNNSKSSYTKNVRILKNNTPHRASAYFSFEVEPEKAIMDFFDVKFYDDLKPKTEKYEVDNTYINFYTISRDSYRGKFYGIRGMSTDDLGKSGKYYAVMNAWKLEKPYEYMEAIQTFIKDSKRDLVLLSDKQLSSLRKIEGFNLKHFSEFEIQITNSHKNAILRKVYNWLPNEKQLKGISRFKGYENLENAVIGNTSCVDIEFIEEHFSEVYQRTVEEFKWVEKYKDDPLVDWYSKMNTYNSGNKWVECKECYDEDTYEYDVDCKVCEGEGGYYKEKNSERDRFVNLISFIQNKGITLETTQTAQ